MSAVQLSSIFSAKTDPRENPEKNPADESSKCSKVPNLLPGGKLTFHSLFQLAVSILDQYVRLGIMFLQLKKNAKS